MLIKYIQTHPIPYQSPMIKYLIKKKINLKVLYRSDVSMRKFYDEDFESIIKWDTKLLDGVKHEFLDYIGPSKVNSIYPITTDFVEKIFDNKTTIIWIHGLKNWYNLILIFLAKIFKKKIFVRDEVSENSKKRSFFNRIFNSLFYRIIDNFIDVYLAIGKQNKKYYLNQNIDKKKIVLVPYVVDNNFFYVKKRIKKNKKLTYLFAAKLKKRKGCDLLLEAINLIKNKKFCSNTKFIIAGEGKMKNEIKNYIKKNKLDNVSLLPFQNQLQLKKLYHKADVFIMPSIKEPWGLTINEAMCSENAIICSNKVGSSSDLVFNNYNGYIFSSNDEIDLSKKILKIYQNKKKIKKFKSNSKKIISKWNFEKCYVGLIKAIRLSKKN
jgi:glycosyltransferase involved in cell wall biosynthesis